jgi:V8-like Glu-specific endopeptidase
MGLAAGGALRQKIYPDSYGVETWDPDNRGRVFVHLVNSEQYRDITGRAPPPTPVRAEDYVRHGMPWFDLYDEARGDVAGSPGLAGVRGVGGGAPEPSLDPAALPVVRLSSPASGNRTSWEGNVMANREWVVQAARQLPPPEAVEAELARGLSGLLGSAFPAEEESGAEAVGLEAMPEAASAGTEALRRVRRSAEDDCRRVVEAGKRGLRKVRQKGEGTDLAPDEVVGMEAIILLVGRPAILIQDGKFFPPPEPWQVLEEHRKAIQETFRSVGRIEVRGHPTLEWVGTGFLAAPGVVMTNRHVAQEFCRDSGKGRWVFEPGVKPRINYLSEFGSTGSAEFALQEVLGVHEVHDLALFRAAARRAPSPLPTASAGGKIKAGRKVYVVGYPASDSRRNDPDVMRRIFAGIYNYKRLQPGEVRKVAAARSLLQHDCSTLGGNSGSCVIDLETHQVLGLHFGGKYRQANQAVALWTLTKDPLLRRAKVQFV